MDLKKLVKQLQDVPLSRMYRTSQRGLARLQLFATGRVQVMLLDYMKEARALILKRADKDGQLDGVRGLLLQSELLKLWSEVFADYSKELQAWREQAGLMAFGVLGMFHEEYVVSAPPPAPPKNGEVQERHLERGAKLDEAIDDGVFGPQLARLMTVAENYLYGDSLTLSDRIWRVENDARDGINNVIMQGIANGESAFDIAKNLEQFLGANSDCPRWTSSRLYGQTKKEIASGSTVGLLTGDACDGSGVSYNALRLARTEIQKIHALATDKALAEQPWVEMEKCNTSPAHAGTDECDEVASGGENCDGVYPVGTINYPLHPHCMCFKTAVLTPEKDFTANLNNWLNGGSYPEMDAYADFLGVDVSTSLLNDQAVLALAVWMFGDGLEEWLQ